MALMAHQGAASQHFCAPESHERHHPRHTRRRITNCGQDIYEQEQSCGSCRQSRQVFRNRNRSRSQSSITSPTGCVSSPRRQQAELHERARGARGAALWPEVKDRLKTSALGLSGGQQQRLCIARALAVRPEVVLMDEPASALDPMATQKIEELIVELKQHYTIVIVTHNMQQAARVSDRTAFFWLGKLIEVNATEKMFTNPEQKLTEIHTGSLDDLVMEQHRLLIANSTLA